MSKSDKELAVDLVLAQIQAQSVIKLNQNQAGAVIKADSVCNLVKTYYNVLQELDTKTE